MTLPLTSPIAAQWVPFLSRFAVEDAKQMSSPAKRERKGAHEHQRNGIGEGKSIRRLSPTPSSLRRQGYSLGSKLE